MDNPEDEILWSHFQDGNQAAFATIYTTYFPVLYHYGYHIARDEELVNDCLQTLFVELWKSRRNLAATTSIKFYLLKAMRRQVYRAIRREDQYTTYQPETDDADVTFSPELEFIAAQTSLHQQQVLQEAINQLSTRQKEAITLLYIEGLSYSEISDMMSVKVRTVYNLVHTALESLRKQLNQPGLWAVLLALVAI